MALLIVATKLYFPLSDTTSFSRLQNTTFLQTPTLDWGRWRQGRSNLPTQRDTKTTKFDFDKVTPSQVVSMEEDELDAYFAHVSSLIDTTSKFKSAMTHLCIRNNADRMDQGDNPITKFFPVEESSTSTSQLEDISTKDIEDAAKNLLNQTLEYNRFNPVKSETTLPSMPKYEAFRNIDHLSEAATELYRAAGKSTLSRMIARWCRKRANVCVMKAW